MPGDRDKFHFAITDLHRELPVLHVALRVRSIPDTHVVCLEGQSESQLSDLCQRLRQDYAIEFDTGPRSVICVETIRKAARAGGKYIRQTGGSGNYAHVKIRLEPNEPGRGFTFINEIQGGVVPKEYIAPIKEGIREAAQAGILAACEVVDFSVTLYDGSYHEVDSNEMAFRIAGSLAFKEAAKKANPILLEPIMAVEVTIPEQHASTNRPRSQRPTRPNRGNKARGRVAGHPCHRSPAESIGLRGRASLAISGSSFLDYGICSLRIAALWVH